jgi:uncharacterized membrane protein YgdD (TMEM256/DUF423 family)
VDKLSFGAGSIAGLLAVALGAFGAHSLQAHLPPERLSIFETGVRYQMYHALALLAVAYAAQRWGGALPAWAAGLFIAGIVLFSGSLYTLAVMDARPIGAITPLGGLAFLAGWVCLGLSALRAS